MKNKPSLQQAQEKTPNSEDTGKWDRSPEGALTFTVNDITIEEKDVPESLREEFRTKDKKFSTHLKAFYTDLNKRNLSPEIPQNAEAFFANAANQYRDILSCSFNEADAMDKGSEWSKLKQSFSSAKMLSSFYGVYEKYSNPANRDDEKVKRIYELLAICPDAFVDKYDKPVFDDYMLAHLCEKYDICPDAHFYVKLCNNELSKNNPYPNFELVKNLCTKLINEKTLNSHAAKHMFTGNEENAGNLLDRDETLPLAAQVLKRSAQAYINRESNADVNFPILIDSYLQYKAKMVQKEETFEDPEVMKNPEIQRLIESNLEKGPNNLYRQLNLSATFGGKKFNGVQAYFVKGHFVDVDGTLIQNGKLNETLYNDMLKAKSLGEPVYIFSGAEKELQKERLAALGVDIRNIPFIDKKELKDCIVVGTIVDDTPPYIQGFCTVDESYSLKPNQSNYEFKMHSRANTPCAKTVPELLALKHNTPKDKMLQNACKNSLETSL